MLRTDRKIIKSRHNAIGEDLIQLLNDTQFQYTEKLEKLNKFKSNKKKETRANVVKIEWLHENTSLLNLFVTVDNEISSLMEVLVLHTPGDSDVHDLALDMGRISLDRDNFKKSLIYQLHELKGMVSDISKYKSVKKGDAASIPGASIFADLLVHIRHAHDEQWRSLVEEETELDREVHKERQLTSQMLRQDRLDSVTQRVATELQLKDDDDDEIAIVMDEWLRKLDILEHAHQTALSVLQAEKLVALRDLGLDGSLLSDALLGGWEPNDHKIFAKVYKQYRASGMRRAAFGEVMRSHLPHKLANDISLHEEWYCMATSLKRRRQAAVETCDAGKEALVAAAQQQLQELRAAAVQARLRDQALLEHEQYRDQLHKRLAELREAREAVWAVERAHREQADRMTEAEEQQRRLDALADAEEKRRAVAAYRKWREERAAEERERRETEERRVAEETAKRVEEDKEKVQRRQELVEQKRVEGRLKQERFLELEKRRLELLCKLAESVPYYEDIQNAESKLEYITASARSHRYVQLGEDYLPGRGQQPLNGFADTRIIRDARFRLTEALRQAGVQHSSAAHQAVQSFCPRPHLAIHGLL